MIGVFFVLGYILSGIIGGKLFFNHFQKMYPNFAERDRDEDVGFAVMVGLAGPVGLVVTVFFVLKDKAP